MEFVQVCELVLQRLFRWNQHICVAIRERERERGTEREILFEGETHNSFLSFRKKFPYVSIEQLRLKVSQAE